MKNLTLLLLLGTLIEAKYAYSQHGDRMYFREIDGETQFLYTLVCSSGKEAQCSLQAVSVGSGKAKLQTCMIDIVSLFQNEPATNPQSGSYIVSLSGGACKYTNTYTFSPNGMVQVKTSPEKPANSACKSFPPKTYNIPVDSTLGFFENVPIAGCKTLHFLKAIGL